MVHVLHLPVFPEESNIHPDCINALILEKETSQEVVHIILNTPSTEEARSWIVEFLSGNSDIPIDEVSFSKVEGLDRQSFGVPLLPLTVGFAAPFQAYFQPRGRFQQEVIELNGGR